MSETGILKGAEFERRVAKLAKGVGTICRFVPGKRKGSHGRLYLGTNSTTLKDRKKEIGPGLLLKMCRDLNINPRDL